MTQTKSHPAARQGGSDASRAARPEPTPTPQTAQRSWRDKIKVHPAADLFPMMGDDELQALADDIKRNGLRERVIIWRASNRDDYHDVYVLDGRNRLTAMELAGIDPFNGVEPHSKYARRVQSAHYSIDPSSHQLKDEPDARRRKDHDPFTVGDPYEFVVSANIHRRHLTQEQKRGIVAELLKAQPEKSNRQIAKQAKVDHKTVGTVREEQQARGEIPHVETRTDTLGRRQPAKPKSSLPRPTEARKIARETGCFALASDGNIYSGSTEEEGAAYAQKRTVGFRIIDAIETLAKAPSGGEWIATAERHWFVDFRRGSIADARNRLDEIERALDAANLGQGEAS